MGRVVGIVAEYNPFHNGHYYHIQESKKKSNADAVVAVISGNFTQRGETSIVNKWSKAYMALCGGADLVIELPTVYATSSAENFARGAIKILDSLKIVNSISFGTENDDIEALRNIANVLNEEPKEYKKKEKPKKEKVVQEVCVEKRKSGLTSFSEFIIKIGVFFLKFLAICILFGVSVYLIGMGIVLAICVYLLIQGVTYFGFYLVMLSLFILGIIFFWLLFNFVLDRKNHGLRLAVSLLVSFTLLGVGCGVATLEVAETEFINSPPSDITTEVMQEELVMNEDTIFIGNISDYVVDNSLKNVLVEYRYYPLGNKMATNIHKDDDFVYLDWSLEKIYLRQELLSHFINDLKEKKVYNYYIEPTIVITANEQNIETIKENRQKYYQNETNYSSCDFIRTYFVEMIKESDDGEDYTVVLSEYLSDDLTTVRLDKDIATDLKVGFYYEFTFKTYQAYIDTDIENIFDENEVVSVKETDKVGVNQIQQDSCSIFY